MQDVTEQRLSERELRAHYGVSQALREWESFELGVVDLLRRIATALDYPMASLWLWDATAEALGCRAFWTVPDIDPDDAFEQVERGISFRVGEGKPGRAWHTREPVVTSEVADRSRVSAAGRGGGGRDRIGGRLSRRWAGRARRGALVLLLRAPRA